MSILASKQIGRGSTVVICERCGCEFRIKNAVFRRGRNPRFCSWECRTTKVIKICEVCGKEFEMKPSHAAIEGRGRYCSIECRSIGYKRRKVFQGKNNPNYKDRDCYSKEYVCRKSQERRARKQINGGSHILQEWEDLCTKYGNCCLACGRDGVPLTEDHVIPLVRGGSNDISNIQPLCQSCNSSKRAKRTDYRKRWAQMTGGEPVILESGRNGKS